MVNERVADYRVRTNKQGLKRVETTVPEDDLDLIKGAAKVLRAGGPLASELRLAMLSVLPGTQAKTGAELLQFFQESPLLSDDEMTLFDIERDQSTGRTADFE